MSKKLEEENKELLELLEDACFQLSSILDGREASWLVDEELVDKIWEKLILYKYN